MISSDRLPCCPGSVRLLPFRAITVVISHECEFDFEKDVIDELRGVKDEVASEVCIPGRGAFEEDMPDILRVSAAAVLASCHRATIIIIIEM